MPYVILYIECQCRKSETWSKISKNALTKLRHSFGLCFTFPVSMDLVAFCHIFYILESGFHIHFVTNKA